ncbi:MAG: superoxide dismutase [Chlamydiota bacterium]|nr:superoxide dismutase [Chlamydiota bacterium]
MPFQQPPLPFSLNALTGFASEEQMDYHYHKHHAAYFNKLNQLLEGKRESEYSLEKIVESSEGPLFNNAAQAWNHTFFWEVISPNGGGEPKGPLREAIDKQFGSYALFCRQFSDAAASLFGAGWAWLSVDRLGKLSILPLSNADTPLRHEQSPLLTLDVWEHAYYIDYRNQRPRFIEQFWEVVNWKQVEALYLNAQSLFQLS